MIDGVSHNHLRVEPGMFRYKSGKCAVMVVCPIHHGRHTALHTHSCSSGPGYFLLFFLCTKGQLYLKIQYTIQEQSRKKQTCHFVFSHIPRNTIARNLKRGKTPANLATEIGESTPVFTKTVQNVTMRSIASSRYFTRLYIIHQHYHDIPPSYKLPNGYHGPQFKHNIYTVCSLKQ